MNINRLSAAGFISALLFSCASHHVRAQVPIFSGSTISGFVFDTDRRPVPDVYVELLNDVNSVLQRMRTDGSGRFLFRGVSEGRFLVRVRPMGTNFEEQTQEVEFYGMSASGRPIRDNVQRDFYLRLKKSGPDAVTGAIFVQDVPAAAKTTYQRAVADLDANRLEDGVAGLQSALKLFPNYYSALERLGLIYTTQQQYEKARDVFTRAVAVNPRSFNGWYGLSCALYALGQWDAAITAAQKAVNLNGNSEDGLLALGLALRQAKKYEEAEKSLRQADKITKGHSPDVHWHLALLYAKNLNRPKDAADELEIYLKINPETPQKDNIRKLIKQYRESPPPK